MNSSDVRCESGHSRNWLYSYQVNACRGKTFSKWLNGRNYGTAENPRTNDHTIHRHCLACNLEPTSRCGAEIYTTSRRFQERIFLIQLDQLERGTCTIPLLSVKRYGQWAGSRMGWSDILCEFVVLVQPPLPCLLLCLTHISNDQDCKSKAN